MDALLSKLDSTADRIVELTVEIRSLNSRQERHSKVDDEIRSELKLLHTRVGTVHDEIGNSERRVSAQIDKLEERLRSVEQWKSRLMGMTTLVAGAIGAIAASIITWMTK
jgi:chromosome segregation ATPase